MKRLLTLAMQAMLAGIAAMAMAQTPPAIARYVPSRPDLAHVFVLDSAHILSAPMIAALQDSALLLQAETHADVAWVTLPTLGGRPIEEAALYIGRTWHIGGAGEAGDPLRNRGLVILYVPDKTTTAGSNFRIEVGNGLEGTITDSRSRTITAAMRQDLKAKHYDAAYVKGWAVAASLVREDFASRAVNAGQPARLPATPTSSGGHPNVIALVLVLVGVLVLVVLLVRWSIRWRVAAPRTMAFRRRAPSVSTDDDEQRRRRGFWTTIGDSVASASANGGESSDGASDSDSSGGGDFGGGGGFSGGGSSDSI